MSRPLAAIAVAVLALAVALPARAQENQAPPERAPKPERSAEGRAEQEGLRSIKGVTTTLRVQVVISRYDGEKKAGSLPYTFVVAAGSDRVRMRMGVDTPIPSFSTQMTDGQTKMVPSGFSYRNVGTNIDCVARDFGDGRYQLNLSVENSSAMGGGGRDAATPAAAAPLFRHFEVSFNPLLRDGQSIQAVASTDPVTGEVVKIDVTMNVVK